MKPSAFLTLIAAAGFALAPMAHAETKPAGSKRADPQAVANFWAGKTHTWKSCKGGIYYGPNWQAQAWCERDGPSVGIGKWSVSGKGVICHDLTWYWPSGEGVGSKSEPVTDRECSEHATAPDGRLLTRWLGDKTKADGWWSPVNSSGVTQGFKLNRKVTRLRRKLGV